MKIISNKKIIAMAILFTFFVSSVMAQNKAENGEKSLVVEKKQTEQSLKAETNQKDAEVVNVEKDKVEEKRVSQGNNLFSTVKQGGPMMIALMLLGLAGMTIIVERIIFFTRNRVWNDIYTEEFLIKAAKESDAKFREDLEEEMRGSFQLYSNAMEKGLALLSGVGNIAPVIGFLGTVIGMISAFASIAAATTVNAKVVAVGIQIALVTTAGGLFVAAPTLAFYYFFTHIIQNRFLKAETIISQECDLLPRLTSSLNLEER